MKDRPPHVLPITESSPLLARSRMAKPRKHTALFEVFGSGNPSSPSGERSGGWSLRAPSWFGRKGSSDAGGGNGEFGAFSSSSSSDNDPTISSTALERFSPQVVDDEPGAPSRPGVRLSLD